MLRIRGYSVQISNDITGGKLTMKNNKLTLRKAQVLGADLVDICNTEGRDNRQLLEYIIDEYLYLISDNKVKELEDIIVNEFGYD